MRQKMKVKKAVIPAAGLGTRFLPATKTVPKEMLPIIDKPTILYVIEEAVDAGIEDIVLIQGRGKTAIEDFFDISYELEHRLEKDGKHETLESLKNIRDKVNIISVRQKVAAGLGHAVNCAAHVIGDSPFAVLLGDEITYYESNDENPTHQLIQQFEEVGASQVSVIEVPQDQVSRYGIVNVKEINGKNQVLDLVEKPSPEQALSRLALPGRYVFTPGIFDALTETPAGKGGEIQLTDAMKRLLMTEQMYAVKTKGLRFDAGDKLGFIEANIEMALRREDMREGVGDLIRRIYAAIV